jgi:hypothetical protein
MKMSAAEVEWQFILQGIDGDRQCFVMASSSPPTAATAPSIMIGGKIWKGIAGSSPWLSCYFMGLNVLEGKICTKVKRALRSIDKSI